MESGLEKTNAFLWIHADCLYYNSCHFSDGHPGWPSILHLVFPGGVNAHYMEDFL